MGGAGADRAYLTCTFCCWCGCMCAQLVRISNKSSFLKFLKKKKGFYFLKLNAKLCFFRTSELEREHKRSSIFLLQLVTGTWAYGCSVCLCVCVNSACVCVFCVCVLCACSVCVFCVCVLCVCVGVGRYLDR